MEQLKGLLKQQHQHLEELSTEIQRKEITQSRVLRLMRMVQRNVEITERIVEILERTQGIAKETPQELMRGFRTRLT
jgi:hypothetical protein